MRATALLALLALAACGTPQKPLATCDSAPVALNPGRWQDATNQLSAPLTPAPISPIAPTEVSDNGQVTTFRFPGNTPVPSFFIVTPDGTERSVNAAADGDLVVVPMTAREFRLRSGDQVVCLKNERYDAIGKNYGTGTTSPDVIRQIRRAPRS